jgi:hypothetical protein
MSIAATPMAFARSIVQAYCRHGQDPSAALRLAQITPEQLALPLGHITARQMEVLSGAAMQELDDESLGCVQPQAALGQLRHAGPGVSMTAPTLGVALASAGAATTGC